MLRRAICNVPAEASEAVARLECRLWFSLCWSFGFFLQHGMSARRKYNTAWILRRTTSWTRKIFCVCGPQIRLLHWSFLRKMAQLYQSNLLQVQRNGRIPGTWLLIEGLWPRLHVAKSLPKHHVVRNCLGIGIQRFGSPLNKLHHVFSIASRRRTSLWEFHWSHLQNLQRFCNQEGSEA